MNNKILYLGILILTLFLSSCSSKSNSEKLIGEWVGVKMIQTYDDGSESREWPEKACYKFTIGSVSRDRGHNCSDFKWERETPVKYLNDEYGDYILIQSKRSPNKIYYKFEDDMLVIEGKDRVGKEIRFFKRCE